jgi:putative transcriptional regulator
MMQGPLARKLRVLRAERGISQADAAKLIGVTPETLSDLERGRRGAYMVTLTKIARAYEVPVADLLDAAEAAEQERKEQAAEQEADGPFSLGQAPLASPEMRADADDALRYFIAAMEGKLDAGELTDIDELLFCHAALRAFGPDRVQQLPGELYYRFMALLRRVNDAGEGWVNFQHALAALEAAPKDSSSTAEPAR